MIVLYTINYLFKFRFSFLSIWVLSLFMLFSVTSNAQLLGYSCDFEDANERAQWTLNVGNHGKIVPNKWYIGLPGKNDGSNGIYVSSDEGVTNGYTKSGVVVAAVRNLTLKTGKYEISFDWQAFGMDSVDGLYVCWVPDSIKTNSVNNSNLPRWVKDWSISFNDAQRLYQKAWNTITDTLDTDDTPHKLVLVWNNSVTGVYPPAAAVDNIRIVGVGMCDKPTNIKAVPTGSTINLQWGGNASKYDVKCTDGEGNTTTYNDVVGNSLAITDIGEGICTFYVRASCDDTESVWVSHSQFIFFPESRCIDYLSLSTENCYIGNTNNPMAAKGYVDKGYQSKESRHTLHWLTTERDPRTGNQLPTVPDGEIASVRLGNWMVNREAEAVEFKFKVDVESSAILLLKYAVVLEDPGHDSIDQPRFTLEVLRKGKPLDKFGCAEAHFAAGFGDKTGWHQTDNVMWKEWETVGINLRNYDGEDLTVRLITFDCNHGAHFGYAYFALGCSDGKITGLTCGDSPVNTFKGPDGFKYRWYLESDPTNTLSEEQELKLTADDMQTYNLDVIHPTKNNCHYTLQASAIPRYPIADMAFKSSVSKCQNIVSFSDSSFIRRFNKVTNEITDTDEKCESVVWDFGDGTTSDEFSPTHIYPEEGGKFTVKLTSGIANNNCVDDTIFEIVLPKLGTLRDTIVENVCSGTNYEHKGKFYFNSGFISDTTMSVNGCDSISTIDLRFHDSYDISISDTICSDVEYYFDGKKISETGKYTANLKSIYGCDSIVKLDILVNQVLSIGLDSIYKVCADDPTLEVAYELHSGLVPNFGFKFKDPAMFEYSADNLTPGDKTLSIPWFKGIVPNRYKAVLTFGEQSCGNDSIDINVDVYYPDTILAQRWNDVIGVKNVDYNGGYEFISFQWYKNDLPIPGAITSNLYVEEGLDATAAYSVLLTNKETGVRQYVCPITPQVMGADSEMVVVFSETRGSVSMEAPCAGRARLWNSYGILLEEFIINEGNNQYNISVPDGVYMIECLFDDGSHSVQKLIK